MPTPQQFGHGNKMGRGPYEKSGIIEDTGLPPGRTVEERFDAFFPTEDVTGDNGRTERKILEHEMEVNVKLWYLPFGNKRTTPFIWQDVTRQVSIDK